MAASKTKQATGSTVDPEVKEPETKTSPEKKETKAKKKPVTEPVSEPEAKPEPEAVSEPEAKPEPAPEAKPETTAKANAKAAKESKVKATKESKAKATKETKAKATKEAKSTDLTKALSKKHVEGMNYNERKQVYGALDQSKDKIFRTPEARAKQHGDWMKEEYQILYSKVSPDKNRLVRVLVTGRVIDEDYGPCLDARLCDKDPEVDRNRGYFHIRIPEDFFVDLTDEENMWNVSDEAQAKRFRNAIMDRFVGIKTDVVVFEVKEFERKALASRLDASQHLSQRYFKGGNTYETRAYFHEGDVATGTVIAAMKDRLIVSVYGQDMEIRTEEASWLAASALYDEFKIGQNVDVKLLAIDNDYIKKVLGKEYHLTKLVGSIKQASVDPNIIFWQDYQVGNKYICRVKATANHQVFCTVNNQITVVCDEIPSGRVRDEAMLRIVSKDEKKHQFRGVLLNREF